MALPSFQTIKLSDRVLTQFQTNVATALNPVIAVPLNSGLTLTNQQLVAGANSINTTLGRTLVGWFVVRQRGAATIYDTQDTNSTPASTLNLVSSSSVSVDLFVF